MEDQAARAPGGGLGLATWRNGDMVFLTPDVLVFEVPYNIRPRTSYASIFH